MENNGKGLAVIEAPADYSLVPSRGMLTAYVEEAKAMITAVRELAASVLREGVDYGQIPGTGKDAKPTLLKPGAETLLATFRLGTGVMNIQERPVPHEIPGHVEYTVCIPIVNRASGEIVGSGVGSCSTMETKYRYRQGERKCPACGKASIIKGKADYGGGWLCFAKKGGCGAKFNDGDKSIEGQSVGRVENPDPADCHNTCLKMAKKRALIDGALTTCAASGVFTQDLDEFADDDQDTGPSGYNPNQGRQNQSQPQARQQQQSQPTNQQRQQSAAPATPATALPTGRLITVNCIKPGNAAELAGGGSVICWKAQFEGGEPGFIWVTDIGQAQKATGLNKAHEFSGQINVLLQAQDLQFIDPKTKQPKTQPACLVATQITGVTAA